jgi:hypothetical protein
LKYLPSVSSAQGHHYDPESLRQGQVCEALADHGGLYAYFRKMQVFSYVGIGDYVPVQKTVGESLPELAFGIDNLMGAD